MPKSISDRITELHHLTLPVNDLAVAERFYSEVLGAGVVRRMGTHFSIQFGGGPRIDIFQQNEALSPDADHPKYAFTIAPEDLLEIASILDANGVGYDGPVHQGPPGAAQIYFDDPSGNHLQLVCQNYPDWASLKAGYDRAKLRYQWPTDGTAASGPVRPPSTEATAPATLGPIQNGTVVRVAEPGTYDINTSEAALPPRARVEILVNGAPICSYANAGTQGRRQSLGEIRTLDRDNEVTARVVHDTGFSEALEVSIARVADG